MSYFFYLCCFFNILWANDRPLNNQNNQNIVEQMDQSSSAQDHADLSITEVPVDLSIQVPSLQNEQPVATNTQDIEYIKEKLSHRWWYERCAYHYLNCSASAFLICGGWMETCSALVFVSMGTLNLINGTTEVFAGNPELATVLINALGSAGTVAPLFIKWFYNQSDKRERLAEDLMLYGRGQTDNMTPVVLGNSTLP